MDLRKGPKGRTEEFYAFIKSGKRSIFVIDAYLNKFQMNKFHDSLAKSVTSLRLIRLVVEGDQKRDLAKSKFLKIYES